MLANIFETGHEYYLEDDYDDEGKLIYKPPPLHESWLGEDEVRDRKEKARERWSTPQSLEEEENDRKEFDSDQPSDYDPPDLVESDVETESDPEGDISSRRSRSASPTHVLHHRNQQRRIT